MRQCESSTGRPRAFSDVIERIGTRERERLALGEVVEAFGERAFGAVMLLFAVVNMLPWPPGGTTLTGVPLLFLSLELASGRDAIWLPEWMERASVSRATFRKLSRRVMKAVRFTEGLSRPRMFFLTGGFGQGLIGLACLFLAIVLVLPVWGANLLPAVAIGFFALGVMQRDGLAVLVGWLLTAATVGVLIVAWRLIVASARVGLDWATALF
ncbi:MAG TPA: exopolysaccharide biosynthesis protein [Brevundimonas sp.]|jgi:hypothetical protein|uniref:exopolysaccharide biosynthesis protein n=1 Tax=Brevundimonas sp. TaxID=1871086 RepID=UPI002DEB4671|nr:exopolysaccharide biosynthesis protein [Brevundimonas sp.]